MLPFFLQNCARQAVASLVVQETETKQSVLCYRADGNGLHLLFLVIDKTIFLEILTSSYVHGLLVVIGSYYTFHFAYQASHKLYFRYLMEFVMGLQPSSKLSTVKYRKMSTELHYLLKCNYC